MKIFINIFDFIIPISVDAFVLAFLPLLLLLLGFLLLLWQCYRSMFNPKIHSQWIFSSILCACLDPRCENDWLLCFDASQDAKMICKTKGNKKPFTKEKRSNIGVVGADEPLWWEFQPLEQFDTAKSQGTLTYWYQPPVLQYLFPWWIKLINMVHQWASPHSPQSAPLCPLGPWSRSAIPTCRPRCACPCTMPWRPCHSCLWVWADQPHRLRQSRAIPCSIADSESIVREMVTMSRGQQPTWRTFQDGPRKGKWFSQCLLVEISLPRQAARRRPIGGGKEGGHLPCQMKRYYGTFWDLHIRRPH